MIATASERTRLLLDRWSNGDARAAEDLLPLVYDELRLLARSYLRREPAGHTLQATSLVHEAYLRLVDQGTATPRTRAHFFSLAAQAMRRILVDHARKTRAQKRGGEWARVEFEEALLAPSARNVDLIALDDALHDLARRNPQHSRIIELRFFGGMTVEEVAELLDLSPTTVKREWRMARAWLRRTIFPDESDGERE